MAAECPTPDCTNEGQEEHTCPLKEAQGREGYNDTCTCCTDCTAECEYNV